MFLGKEMILILGVCLYVHKQFYLKMYISVFYAFSVYYEVQENTNSSTTFLSEDRAKYLWLPNSLPTLG